MSRADMIIVIRSARFVKVLGATAAAILLATAPAAVAVTVDVQINGRFDSQFQVGGVAQGAVSGGYSLHAGAQVFGVLPSLDVRHDPAQPAGVRTTAFPVAAPNAYQGPGKELVPTPAPALSQNNPATRYTTKPYFFTVLGAQLGDPGDTGFAVASGVNAAGTAETDAQAREAVSVVIPAAGRYQVNTAGSEAQIIKTDARLAPAGKVGRIMIDPWSYGPSFAGDDALIGGLSLNGSVTIDDPSASAEVVFQAASNMQTTDIPGYAPIGTSYEGLSLIYTLGITFHPGTFATPDIGFAFNPSYEFFDPADITFSSPLSPGSLESYVIGKITSAMVPGTNGFSFTGDVPLFVYRGMSVGNVEDLQLDQLQAVLAESPQVPEPVTGVLGLLAVGAAGWSIGRRRRA